jgi:hypothetical protein
LQKQNAEGGELVMFFLPVQNTVPVVDNLALQNIKQQKLANFSALASNGSMQAEQSCQGETNKIK